MVLPVLYLPQRGTRMMPDVARWLVDSWPGAWALAPIVTVEVVVTEAIEAPPVDKMISAPTKAKGKRRG